MPMHITDWKENFISKMITRGRNYWRAGAVKKLHCTQEKITADVEGTRLYRVEITLEDDAVATLSCTCPFAKEGANCKHIAKHAGGSLCGDPSAGSRIARAGVGEEAEQPVR